MDITDKKLGFVDVEYYKELYNSPVPREKILCSYMGVTDNYLVLYNEDGRMLRLLDSRNIASITPHYDTSVGAH